MANYKSRTTEEIGDTDRFGNYKPGSAKAKEDAGKANLESAKSFFKRFTGGDKKQISTSSDDDYDARKQIANDAIDKRIAEKGPIQIEPAGRMPRPSTLSDRILDSLPMATITNKAAEAGIINPPVYLEGESASQENERRKTGLMSVADQYRTNKGIPSVAIKKGGKVSASGKKNVVKTVKSSPASRRGDGIAQRGKTKGRFV